MKNIITYFFLLGLFAVACDQDEKIDFVKSGMVYGKLTYKNPKTGVAANVPKGATVKVVFNPDGFPFYGYSFKTLEDGIYRFQPMLEGSYDLVIAYHDSLIQFNAGLVVPKDDLDSTRASEYVKIVYQDSARITISDKNKFLSKDFSITKSGTDLRLSLTDEAGNALRGMRVCIYDNEAFANQNSPFCGGSLAYLSSDEKGEVFFTGLNPKSYYIVARGEVGHVYLNNQFSGATKTTGMLTDNIINTRFIILK